MSTSLSTNSGPQSSSMWELSLYEAQRKPHEVITDDTYIGVSPHALRSEFMCPICLDLMKNTQTTKECLHRFCQECIITALRSGNKECPTCRKKLVSKRSLRPDPNFDALIAKIYPNRDELSQHLERQQRNADSNPFISSILHKRRAATPLDASVSGSSHSPSPNPKAQKLEESYDTEHSDTSGSREDSEVHLEFQVRPHPLDESASSLEIRNLSTSPEATVAHLARYLGLVCKPEENNKTSTDLASQKFTISTENKDSNYVTLKDDTCLGNVCENYWTSGNDKLLLYVSMTDNTTTAI